MKEKERERELAEALASIRAKSGLSPQALSELSGVSPETIIKYERGIRLTRVSDYCKLVEALGYEFKIRRQRGINH